MLDLLITGAEVIDGGGKRAWSGDVGVADGRIVLVRRGHADQGRASDLPPAGQTIAAAGRTLAPGFIDVHTHSDLAPFTDVWMDSALRQGVTTVVVGNCGGSAWPKAGLSGLADMLHTSPAQLGGGWDSAAAYLDAVDAAGPACNVATLAGFGSLRTEVMEHERRPASEAEIDSMRRLLTDAMEGGALGLSSGLIYVPDMYASTEEVAAVAAAVAPFGGLYATHMRAEGRLVFDAVRETIEIGRRAEVHAHVSHLKLDGRLAWGRTAELLQLVFEAGASADQYPYTAWETDLSAFLPPWAPVEELETLLADEPTRRRLVSAVERGEAGWESSVADAGWESVVVEDDVDGAAGHSVAELAAARGMEPVELAFDLLRRFPSLAVSGHSMDEDDVRRILAHDEVVVGSDGTAVGPDGPLHATLLHPRSYGTFPRVLGHYARDLGVLTLEAAVRKMTSLPAARFGLAGRGLVGEGAVADLVLFDRSRIADTATFSAPHAYPTGIALVVVNGRVAFDGRRRRRAGRALRRGAMAGVYVKVR
jgi:N-acyl-D-amino-acid deacylase